MNRNDLISAPQIADVHAAYDVWHKTHVGDMDAFYRFMTTPTSERAEFMATLPVSESFTASTVSIIIQRHDES